jgi:hypothetical protein
MSRRCVSLLVSLIVLAAPRAATADRIEVASFTADPSPARVYLDDTYIGDTPLDLTFQCGQMGDRRYRIERQGCAPAEGILNARVAPGRIVGAAFSFAISLAFQCPQYFVPVRVRLECGDATGAAPAPADEKPVSVDQLPPRVNLRRQPPAPQPTVPSDADVRAQLSTLKDMRSRGVITEEQYQQERERLLHSLGY